MPSFWSFCVGWARRRALSEAPKRRRCMTARPRHVPGRTCCGRGGAQSAGPPSTSSRTLCEHGRARPPPCVLVNARSCAHGTAGSHARRLHAPALTLSLQRPTTGLENCEMRSPSWIASSTTLPSFTILETRPGGITPQPAAARARTRRPISAGPHPSASNVQTHPPSPPNAPTHR